MARTTATVSFQAIELKGSLLPGSLLEQVARSASEAEIRDHLVKANFEAVTGNRAISQAEVNAILELLDAVSPRSVLRDLNEELRRILAEAR